MVLWTFAFDSVNPQTRPVETGEYQLATLRNGTRAVYVASYDEKMHPGLGPAAEARTLYVEQLRIRERMQRHTGPFVVWDVGLGAAANALTLLRSTRDLAAPLTIVSFDNVDGPLAFALTHAEKLGYFNGYEDQARQLLKEQRVTFRDGEHNVSWEFVLGDFPPWCANPGPQPPPHAIFYDAFSPAKNPAMWTLPLFRNLFSVLDPARPCALTTYSRSTMLRVTLLLAGFFVGQGRATGLKEETTVAANQLELVAQPLDQRWLERAERSGSAAPLTRDTYHQRALSPEALAKLKAHPQFHQL